MDMNVFQEFYAKSEASYEPGFMQIKLSNSYTGDLKNMDKNAIGTFLHEYIHYLQNISTPWGLYDSMVRFKTMVEVFAAAQENPQNCIHPPIVFAKTSKLQESIEYVRFGNGSIPLEEQLSCYCIDRNIPITWTKNNVNVGKHVVAKYEFKVTTTDGKSQHLHLGANIIKESMAALFQNIIDNEATHAGYDIPYNFLSILAEQAFPNIVNDKIKLITVSYLSLFSMSPADVLLEQLDYANKHDYLTAQQLVDNYLTNSIVKISNTNKKIRIADFLDNTIEKLKNVIKKALTIEESDYIDYILDRAKINNGTIPLLTPLIGNDNFNANTVQMMFDYFGLPLTFCKQELTFPQSVKYPDKTAGDIVALLGAYGMFKYLIDYHGVCPLFFVCSDKGGPFKDECYGVPWEGKDCPMIFMGELLKLKK